MKTLFALAFSLILLQDFGSVANAQSADDLLKEGVAKAKNGEMEEAIHYLTRSIQQQEHNPNAYYNRGLAKRYLDDYSGAWNDYQKALQQDSLFPELWMAMGKLFRITTDYEASLKAFSTAIQLNPEEGQYYFQRGITLRSLGYRDSACIDILKADALGLSRIETYVKQCRDTMPDLDRSKVLLAIEEISKEKSYGYDEDDPIKVGRAPDGGTGNEYRYLDLLRGPDGRDIQYERLGSCCAYPSENGLFGQALLDIFEISYTEEKGNTITKKIYISCYDYEKPKVPVGLNTVKPLNPKF
jgi:tetratricopeptide (TPR) repeat protein